jgi:hypothetical protein
MQYPLISAISQQSAAVVQCSWRLQAAVAICDEGLVLEGCTRVHNALVPLLSLPQKCRMLLKPLLAVHTCALQVKNLIQDSFAGQEAKRFAAARALASLTLHGLHLAKRFGEDGILAELGALRPPLLAVYDPCMDTPGRKNKPAMCAPCFEGGQSFQKGCSGKYAGTGKILNSS